MWGRRTTLGRSPRIMAAQQVCPTAKSLTMTGFLLESLGNEVVGCVGRAFHHARRPESLRHNCQWSGRTPAFPQL